MSESSEQRARTHTATPGSGVPPEPFLSVSIRVHPWLKGLVLPAVVFGFLWFILINRLRIAWTLIPQYSYGWAVLFLCAFLVWQRIHNRRPRTTDLRPLSSDICLPPTSICYFILAFLAILYSLVRLVQAANPVWTLVSWGLALVVIGLTFWFLQFNA